MILLAFICGIVAGICISFMGVGLLSLLQSSKRADLCRMPDASQEAFEPTEVNK